MSFVTTQPEILTAAVDEVSALAAAQFAVHAQMYLFVGTLATSSASYVATETANAMAAS